MVAASRPSPSDTELCQPSVDASVSVLASPGWGLPRRDGGEATRAGAPAWKRTPRTMPALPSPLARSLKWARADRERSASSSGAGSAPRGARQLGLVCVLDGTRCLAERGRGAGRPVNVGLVVLLPGLVHRDARRQLRGGQATGHCGRAIGCCCQGAEEIVGLELLLFGLSSPNSKQCPFAQVSKAKPAKQQGTELSHGPAGLHVMAGSERRG